MPRIIEAHTPNPWDKEHYQLLTRAVIWGSTLLVSIVVPPSMLILYLVMCWDAGKWITLFCTGEHCSY
jgi:hypothetical protein